MLPSSVYIGCIIEKLDCGKLSVAVCSALQRICGTWKANLPQLAPPNKRYTVSVHAIKNSRRKMEDRHEHYNDINHLFGLAVSVKYVSSIISVFILTR